MPNGLLNDAYFAPAIKQTVFQGTQPAQLEVRGLIGQRSPGWQEQMEELGFGSAMSPA